MQLYLVRHAESENNARPGYLRVEDPALTAVGRLQAAALAQWTRTAHIDTLITSPFLRTLQTTQPVTEATGIGPLVWHDVYECGGCYRGHGDDASEGGPGLGASKIREIIPGATLDTSITESGWYAGRKRETETEHAARCVTVLDRLIATFGNRGEHIFAIVHADFKRQLLVEILGSAADVTAFGPMRNTGITKIDFDGSRWRLDWFNSVSHLPSRLITGVQW